MYTTADLQKSVESAERATRVCVALGFIGVVIGVVPAPARWTSLMMITAFSFATLGLLGSAHFSSVASMRRRELKALRTGSMRRDIESRR